jgi:hypothetical protein
MNRGFKKVRCKYSIDRRCSKLDSIGNHCIILKGYGVERIVGCSIIKVDWVAYLVNKKHIVEVK